MEVRWIAFPLHPETPEEGMSLEELFKGREIDLPSSMERLKKVAAELGLPWGMRTRTYNSRRAQELGKWAESLDKGDEFHMAVFQAYFVHGRNIADISILKESLGQLVLTAGRWKRHWLRGPSRKQWTETGNIPVSAALQPFQLSWSMGGKVIGAQPYQALADLVMTAGG